MASDPQVHAAVRALRTAVPTFEQYGLAVIVFAASEYVSLLIRKLNLRAQIRGRELRGIMWPIRYGYNPEPEALFHVSGIAAVSKEQTPKRRMFPVYFHTNITVRYKFLPVMLFI
jgi:hypothetical protein